MWLDIDPELPFDAVLETGERATRRPGVSSWPDSPDPTATEGDRFVASEEEVERLACAADELADFLTAWSQNDPTIADNRVLRDLVQAVNRALRAFGLG